MLKGAGRFFQIKEATITANGCLQLSRQKEFKTLWFMETEFFGKILKNYVK